MRVAPFVPVLLALLVKSSVALPAKRDAGNDDCPFVFNEKGKPSLEDLADDEKPHDMGSLAIAAALVTISPQYVAGLFRYGENELVPAKAKLRPEEGQNGCQPSAFQTFLFEDSDAATDVDSKVTVNDIFVDLRGSSTEYHGAYIGKELCDHGDNAAHSAWVYIFQTTMLGSARSDAEAGRKWKNTDSDGLVQEFNGILPQDYTNLGHMLKLVTGQEAAQEKISDLIDDDLKVIMDAAHKSPVLIIPKATSNGRLDGGRIWIGWTKATNHADKWTLFNPIEKKKGKEEYTLAEIKELGETIVFLSDHSPLED